MSVSVWTPIVFAAYAIGRRQVTTRFWFCLTTVEAITLLFTMFLMRALYIGWH